jgi:hypothetical protein
MPKYLEKQPDGSLKVYTEEEYRNKNGGLGLVAFAGIVIFGIYTTFMNLMNFDAIKDFGWSLYLSNFIHFHGKDECFYIPEDYYVSFIDLADNRKSIPVFPSPLDTIVGRPSREDLLDQYEGRTSAAIEFPAMVKYRGYVSKDYNWQTDINKGTSTIDWSAVTFDAGEKIINGFVPFHLPDTVNHALPIEKDLSEIDVFDVFIRDFEIGNKISGNRFAVRVNESCEVRVVEI